MKTLQRDWEMFIELFHGAAPISESQKWKLYRAFVAGFRCGAFRAMDHALNAQDRESMTMELAKVRRMIEKACSEVGCKNDKMFKKVPVMKLPDGTIPSLN